MCNVLLEIIGMRIICISISNDTSFKRICSTFSNYNKKIENVSHYTYGILRLHFIYPCNITYPGVVLLPEVS